VQCLSELDARPSKQIKENKLGYEGLDQVNIGASHVTPCWFVDNVTTRVLYISQLRPLPFPLGNGQNPVVANEHIAAVAVNILQDLVVTKVNVTSLSAQNH
jgi:hypothetical protein